MIRLLTLFLLWSLGCSAQAITCTSITSSGVSFSYVNNTTMSVQGTFRVTCTRNAGDPATSVTYDVVADNGTNAQGQNNRATLVAATLRYDVYTGSTCGTQWKGNVKISDTITWTGGATGSQFKDTNFWGCIVTAQTATSSGTYADTVVMTLSYTGGTSITGNLPVNIYAPAVCTFTSPPTPSTISIAYTSLGPERSGSTLFSVQCTNGMPYTLATDVAEGVVVNLRYLLSITGPTMIGSGAPKQYSITATIPAGQAGTCSGGTCVGTNAHTVIVTY